MISKYTSLNNLSKSKISRLNVGQTIKNINQQRLEYSSLNHPFDISSRVKCINKGSLEKGYVLYWMRREQRVQDNWSLIYAQNLAHELNKELGVIYFFQHNFMNFNKRHNEFIIENLKEIEIELDELNIPFFVGVSTDRKMSLVNFCKGKSEIIPNLNEISEASVLVYDFMPLYDYNIENQYVIKKLKDLIDIYMVDAHNIVPSWIVTDKREIGARTFRPKVLNHLKNYLTEFPTLVEHVENKNEFFSSKTPIDWINIENEIINNRIDEPKSVSIFFKGGYKNAITVLENFKVIKLKNYSKLRNDPNEDLLSSLSPYINFGQISAQRIILEINQLRTKYPDDVHSFVEECVIRRELSDNFLYYSKNTNDYFELSLDWAKKTLKYHKNDKRQYIYTLEQLEYSKTHDILWNSAQQQMLKKGKMHEFLRMYWAKKILEWTLDPQEALKTSLFLNDKYNLDGNDPNSIIGCLWAICGVHDHGWRERDIFGKIRYMNYEGCKRKFNIDAFVEMVNKI